MMNDMTTLTVELRDQKGNLAYVNNLSQMTLIISVDKFVGGVVTSINLPRLKMKKQKSSVPIDVKSICKKLEEKSQQEGLMEEGEVPNVIGAVAGVYRIHVISMYFYMIHMYLYDT
jgi:hypothetical protein